MSYRVSILDFLRAEGLTVIEVNGWRTRGSDVFSPGGSVNHHTANPNMGLAPSLGMCTNGRGTPGDADYVPGPLCQVLQSRQVDARGLDVVYLIAAGRANHAGTGGWAGLVGNSRVWGLEVEHMGTSGEAFPSGRYETSIRVHTAFAKCSMFEADMISQHREWTYRKVDFASVHVNPTDFRSRVNARLHPVPAPAPTPVLEDDVLTCPIPWVTSSTPGREPYFRATNGPVPNSIRIWSKNSAPLDGVPVARRALDGSVSYVPGGTFIPNQTDAHGRVVDQIIYDFWTRILYDTIGEAEGIWIEDASRVVVASMAGGVYDIARKVA